MRKNVLRVFSCFLAVVVLSLSVFPAQAVNTEYTSVESFWNWVAGSGDIAQEILSHIPIGSRDNVCAKSDDGYHHSNGFTKDGGDGYFLCVCRDCGREFRGYVSDLPPAYNDYVETLPATGYTSTGGLLWQPTWKNVYSFSVSSLSSNILELYPFDLSGTTFSFSDRLTFFPDFKVSLVSFPYYGAYRVYVPFTASYRYQGTKGVVVSKQLFSRVSSETTRLTPSSSFAILISTTNQYPDWASKTYTSFNFVLPIFEVIPDTVIDKDTTYNINTRPTSITGGNYGIVGDNGQITKVEDNSTIINETNNTFYNPATGTTVPIVNWSYDYSDRSYKVTLESGDTATITYGDENITISQITTTEGDTITNNYTIYYLVDGSGSENPPPLASTTGRKPTLPLQPAQFPAPSSRPAPNANSPKPNPFPPWATTGRSSRPSPRNTTIQASSSSRATPSLSVPVATNSTNPPTAPFPPAAAPARTQAATKVKPSGTSWGI